MPALLGGDVWQMARVSQQRSPRQRHRHVELFRSVPWAPLGRGGAAASFMASYGSGSGASTGADRRAPNLLEPSPLGMPCLHFHEHPHPPTWCAALHTPPCLPITGAGRVHLCPGNTHPPHHPFPAVPEEGTPRVKSQCSPPCTLLCFGGVHPRALQQCGQPTLCVGAAGYFTCNCNPSGKLLRSC